MEAAEGNSTIGDGKETDFPGFAGVVIRKLEHPEKVGILEKHKIVKYIKTVDIFPTCYFSHIFSINLAKEQYRCCLAIFQNRNLSGSLVARGRQPTLVEAAEGNFIIGDGKATDFLGISGIVIWKIGTS